MGKIIYRLKILIRDLLINTFASAVLVPRSLRYAIYKVYGIDTKTKNISPKCFIGSNNLIIGSETFINYGCFFDSAGGIKIGDNCQVAMEVLFCSSTHEIGLSRQRAGGNLSKPIEVGNGCWIGARVSILPGVTIEEGCIIAAGAVVINDCKANGLYAGIPATRIKDLLTKT
ncbi:acyltransferase [Niallia sp. FSL K6-0077]|uniref:acyltransferase n=1 Tax=Niallia sp. FSL K6-0077 TaxID=2954743 RepID=UPI0030FC4A9B